MAGLTQLIVVQFDQCNDCIINCWELNERHLAILGEKLECLNVKALGEEGLLQVLLFHRRRDVGQVQGGGWRVNVWVVFGTWKLIKKFLFEWYIALDWKWLSKKQKAISEIICDGIRYKGQNEITSGVTNFYQNLYKNKVEPEETEDNFYENCPNLS